MELSNQIREDLLITALEGGSNYWYYLPYLNGTVERFRGKELSLAEAIWKAVLIGAIIPVYDIENNEYLGGLSLTGIERGEQTMQKKSPKYFYECVGPDPDFDAITSDVWFQYAVMNEIVFG